MGVEELYEDLSFGHRVGFGSSPAALVIDFQKGLTVPGMKFYAPHDNQIEATSRLLAALREKRYPVIFTVIAWDEAEVRNDCYPALRKMPDLKQIRTGTEMAEVDGRLAPRPEEFVLVKKFQSAFIGTPLSSILTGLRVDTLIVAGCATSGCLRASVTDACGLGYRVILPRECIGDFDVQIHQANMFDMDAKNGDEVSVVDALNSIASLPMRRTALVPSRP